MFKVGDKVRILDTEDRTYYKQVSNKIGEIKQITKFKRFEDDKEHIKYYVEIPEFENEYQDSGWWIFYNEQSLRLMADEATCDDQRDEYDYAISTRTDWADILLERNLINEKGDNNNMMNEILEIYKERRRVKINKKYDDMENAIKQCDPRYKVWRECVDTLLKLYEEDKILGNNAFTQIKLRDETRHRLDTIHETRCDELNDLSDKLNEVQAQLDMCETYEQKQNILRTYKIIKENGKVNG